MTHTDVEEWRIKNQHCNADEIDERQAVELAVILDKWQKNEIPPWEALLQTAHTIGARYCGFLFNYEYYHDCSTPEGARNHVVSSYHKYRGVFKTELKSEERQDIADATWSVRQKYQEAVTGLKEILRPEVLDENQQPFIHENISAIRSRLENADFNSWQAAVAIAEVLLPSPPLKDFQVDPKFLDHVKFLQSLGYKGEEWQEFASELEDPQERRYAEEVSDKRYSAFYDFKEQVDRARDEAAEYKKDTSATLDAFTPETEKEFKRPLAILFAKRLAYEIAYRNWVTEKEAEYEAEHNVSLSQLRAEEKARIDTAYKEHMSKYADWAQAEAAKGMVLNEFSKISFSLRFKDEGTTNQHLKDIENKTSKSEFRWHYRRHEEEIDKDVALVAPINFPDRKLCSVIEIVPSGTGLVQLFDKDPYHSWTPTDIGRITTYSVSFKPKHPGDLEVLKDTVGEAVRILGSIPYKYTLPGYTESGESYKRIASDSDGWRQDYEVTTSPYIETKDGKATPSARFDLDDLWTLYYLLEPTVEPNAQIAAAMNSARYAEERGAKLKPDDYDGYGGRGHVVADESGYLKKSKPETMLADAMRESLVDFALNNIDEAGFGVRVSTLAHHTLAGNIVDPIGNFPTYRSMITDARSNKGAVVTYEAALKERAQALLRCLLGEPEDSKRPLYAALIAAVREIAEPLKEQSRDRARHQGQEREDAFYAKQRERRGSGYDPLKSLLERFNEAEFALKRSDVVAGRAGVTDEEAAEKRKNGLTAPTHLVVASSAVETAIDGVHPAHVTWEWHYFKKGEPVEHYHDGEELVRWHLYYPHEGIAPCSI